MAKRERWPRAKWYRAHHLNRLLLRMAGGYPFGPPPLVEAYIRLCERHRLNDDDPLRWPSRIRNQLDGIPF